MDLLEDGSVPLHSDLAYAAQINSIMTKSALLPCPPPPMEVTDETYNIIYNRQLNDSTLDTLAALVTLTPPGTPPQTPSPLLLPLGHTCQFQGKFVEPLAPPPSVVHLDPPPEPPDPPARDPWCICDPCLDKLTEY